jgi:hypothetical protein
MACVKKVKGTAKSCGFVTKPTLGGRFPLTAIIGEDAARALECVGS